MGRRVSRFQFQYSLSTGEANADADTLSRTTNDMHHCVKLCTEETTQHELQTIIQTVKLQEQRKLNWVSSLINDPSILNVDAQRSLKWQRP